MAAPNIHFDYENMLSDMSIFFMLFYGPSYSSLQEFSGFQIEYLIRRPCHIQKRQKFQHLPQKSYDPVCFSLMSVISPLLSPLFSFNVSRSHSVILGATICALSWAQSQQGSCERTTSVLEEGLDFLSTVFWDMHAQTPYKRRTNNGIFEHQLGELAPLFLFGL